MNIEIVENIMYSSGIVLVFALLVAQVLIEFDSDLAGDIGGLVVVLSSLVCAISAVAFVWMR